MNNQDHFIEKFEGSGPNAYYYSVRQGPLPLKLKFQIAALAIGGLAIGTVLFLFFITAFIYLFLPAMLIFMIWQAFSRRK